MDTGVALLILAGLGGLWYYTRTTAAANLIFYVGNITNFQLNDITAELHIQNTSNVPFLIASMAGNITVDGTVIGNIQNFSPVTVGANSQTVYPIHFVPQLIGALSELISTISEGSIPKDIIFSGSVNANGIQVPLNLTWKIGG